MPDGSPKHDADLRVARKAGLYPSVTSIDKDQFVNTFLEHWKRNEIVLAAIDNPRQPHESGDDYGDRLYELSLQKSVKAAEFGNKLHDACEIYPQMPLEPTLVPYMTEFGALYDNWFSETLEREVVLVDSDLGVAGRADAICVGKPGTPIGGLEVIVDFKSQGVKKSKRGVKEPSLYDSWKRQLSFYAVARAKKTGRFPDIPACVNIIIDSNEPCRPWIQIWLAEEILESYHDFVIATYCWCRKRGYWPAGSWNIYHGLPDPSRPDRPNGEDYDLKIKPPAASPNLTWGQATQNQPMGWAQASPQVWGANFGTLQSVAIPPDHPQVQASLAALQAAAQPDEDDDV